MKKCIIDDEEEEREEGNDVLQDDMIPSWFRSALRYDAELFPEGAVPVSLTSNAEHIHLVSRFKLYLKCCNVDFLFK